MTPYYDDGLITLYHGDSRDIIPSLPPVDLVVADPPYAFGGARTEWQVTASVVLSLALAAEKVTKGGAMAVMTAASGRGIEFIQGAIGKTLALNRLLIWHKTFVNSAVAGPWRWDIVPILIFGKASFGRAQFSSCYRSDGHATQGTTHPAELPQGLGDWLIHPFTDAATVLDPFVGSGVFLASCKAVGKRAIGIEKEERYCAMAVERIGQGRLDLEELAAVNAEATT